MLPGVDEGHHVGNKLSYTVLLHVKCIQDLLDLAYVVVDFQTFLYLARVLILFESFPADFLLGHRLECLERVLVSFLEVVLPLVLLGLIFLLPLGWIPAFAVVGL